ncbi:hypothetical protein V8E54_003994 [Elaphomyces granulatus]
MEPSEPRPLFNRWNAQHAELDNLRFEYNPSTEVMIIKCMPSGIHESVPGSFIMQATLARDRLLRTAKKAVTVGMTTEFNGFINSNMDVSSAKECDGFLKLKDREYQSVVMESGLSEPLKDLREDARS